MRSCMYVNCAAAAVMLGLFSFAACGGGQPQAAAPATESSASPAAATDVPAPAGSSSPATGSAASSTASLAASPAPSASPEQRREQELNDIRAVVAGNRDSFRACYDRVEKKHPGIKGNFVLTFVVNPDGSVKSAEADPTKSEIHVPELESCTVGVMKGLKFAPNKKGFESKVNYPFNFNPKAPAKP